jgi:hypothetical protein
MPTYAENAHKRERDARRAAQDARDAQRHRDFSLSAQDQHHKWERAHFSVVGEGSRSANENFRSNYDRIDWGRA